MTVEVSAVGGAGTVSPTSPLGSALLGKKVGETVEVQAPKGAWQRDDQADRLKPPALVQHLTRWQRVRSSATSAA